MLPYDGVQQPAAWCGRKLLHRRKLIQRVNITGIVRVLYGKESRQRNSTHPMSQKPLFYEALTAWSGRRESNPRMQLGKLPFYH